MFMNSVIDLTAYHNEYLGKRHLKDELGVRFPQAHSFLYRRLLRSALFFPPFFQNPLDASGKRSIITSKVNSSKMK